MNLNVFCRQQSKRACPPLTAPTLNLSFMPRTFKTRNIPCIFPGCGREFTNRAGLTNHQRIHAKPSFTRVHQPAARTATLSRSPSPDAFGQADDAGIHAPAEDGPPPFPQPRKHEIITYHPFINGVVNSIIALKFN